MKSSAPECSTKNWLEWSVFAISSILILGTLAFLSLSALRVTGGPAEIAVEIGDPVKMGDRLRVPLIVKNHGQSVATNVEVGVTIGEGISSREASVVIDFIPRGASRTGTVSFREADEATKLSCEVIGYEEP